jgi:3-hydroxy-9,10-secoandrosta-1,3,5(10)-triene-9,17-dione monooxygenase
MEATTRPAPPTEREIAARARAMVPSLRARAAETEALRRLPLDTHRAFAEAGFYKIMQPRHYGGYELEFGTQTELGVELGRGCGSSAWVATVICCHAWLAGMFPEAAQDEIWGGNPDAVLSSSFLPVGPRVERVAGGYRVSGRWKFSSGVELCDWAIVLLPIAAAEGDAARSCFALLKLSQCRIDDVWHAVGLAGSGSNDVIAESVLVPEHRLLDIAQTQGGPTPGSAVNDHYLYRLPLLSPFTFNLVGNALGVARGIAETIVESLQQQRTRFGAPLGAIQSVQLRIAEAEAEIEAASALVFADRDEIVRRAKAGESFALKDRARYRRDVSFATQMCTRAVERLFPIVGAHGLMSDHPVQRGWRDLRAISHHFALTWDVQGTAYGAVALGLPCPDPRL